MTIFFERGGDREELSEADFQEALAQLLEKLGQPNRVLAIPPDHTRLDSRAGDIVCLLHQMLGPRLTDVMPALGTHHAMSTKQLDMMFPGLPHSLIREHRWRDDVKTLGFVPREFVESVTEGHYSEPWPAQVNRLLLEGNHDLILSVGQVVPHEVIGMANYNKNIFVGTGGASGIHESHYLSALYGMERIMGRCATPLRKILNQASDMFCTNMPIVYVLTVVESSDQGKKLVRGLYIGDDHEVFWRAGRLAARVNCFRLETAPKTMVVYMDPKKYERTWLANKAIYRTRMAIADGGKLFVIAPGVKTFGEDATIDELIRKHGYRTTPEVLEMVKRHESLRNNLSAAAHLIHGSSENRFEIVYCPGHLTPEEVRSVGYSYDDPARVSQQFEIDGKSDGWHTSADGEPFYFVRDPGLGLWMNQQHPYSFDPNEA
jgi:nickel-dependent lactate racemase